IALQEGVCTSDHVAEGAEILLAQPSLHAGEDARNLAAAAQDFRLVELVLRFGNPRYGHFPALEALYIFRVLFRRDEFVVTPANEIPPIVWKYSDSLGALGGTHS